MKKYIWGLVTILCSLITAASVFADSDGGLDSATEQALKQTQAMLANPTLRNAAIAGDARAQGVAAQVRSATGGDKDKEEKVFNIANEVFAKMVKDTGGDTSLIQAKLEAAMKDPESLKGSFTPAQLAEIRSMGLSMPQQK